MVVHPWHLVDTTVLTEREPEGDHRGLAIPAQPLVTHWQPIHQPVDGIVFTDPVVDKLCVLGLDIGLAQQLAVDVLQHFNLFKTDGSEIRNVMG